MGRILLALAIIALAGTTAFATTRAVWTDTVTVASNNVVTGTTDLQVSANDGATWSQTTVSSPFSVTGLIPGQEKGDYAFSLKNLSSAPLNFNLGGKINLATNIAGNPDKTKLLIQIYNWDDPAENTDWKTLSEWEAAGVGGISFNSSLNNGATKRYGIKVKLDSSATNEWQGKIVIFSVEVIGTQAL